jgi:hypothetical protein
MCFEGCINGSTVHRMGGTKLVYGFVGTTNTYEILDSGRQAKIMIWKVKRYRVF